MYATALLIVMAGLGCQNPESTVPPSPPVAAQAAGGPLAGQPAAGQPTAAPSSAGQPAAAPSPSAQPAAGQPAAALPASEQPPSQPAGEPTAGEPTAGAASGSIPGYDFIPPGHPAGGSAVCGGDTDTEPRGSLGDCLRDTFCSFILGRSPDVPSARAIEEAYCHGHYDR